MLIKLIDFLTYQFEINLYSKLILKIHQRSPLNVFKKKYCHERKTIFLVEKLFTFFYHETVVFLIVDFIYVLCIFLEKQILLPIYSDVKY